ncbi:NADP-dependent 3-hydroxy acid dehydrogenase YdfG [Lentzea fradiae]|uniref:NADP-dependent 3-hydroxy acid dehydrogenase YdfG n=1 Tax=Lentzea fradiae TaxID=200378 RepID=A0A1G7V907_9PSEU|nr:SDR family NAD(P)-dependent oxidoreductase [Lentzea fradiae]SDG55819.1 NADP-dependent 3-hydroxy acid dehydrogenase YdfG [Lentzea fradiae]
MRKWAGAVAFITGGANGIGLGIARALARRGVLLALADLDAAALEDAAGELTRLTKVRTYRLDVRDRAGFAEAADEAERELGPVDLLFNNAGIVPVSSVADLTYDKWDLALDVNLNGVVNGVQTFLPRMIGRKSGHIVNTSSGAGLVPDANPLYVTAKFAVVGLSDSLRLSAAAHGVDVSVLCPGPVDTGILDRTRSLDSSVGIPDEHAPAVAEFLRNGPSVDQVGEEVLAAIEAGKQYVYTSGYDLRPQLEARAAALLSCL